MGKDGASGQAEGLGVRGSGEKSHKQKKGLRKGDGGKKRNFAEMLLYARCFRTIISFNFYNNLVKFTGEVPRISAAFPRSQSW